MGKTSLIRYLVDAAPRNPDEKKTPGIATRHRIETLRWSPAAQSPTLNIWDFGGQEIMHGTHKFFLTERSLYLLVLEDRREDDESVHDWLRIIANRGGNSPVIIVINKCDDGQQHLLLNEPRLARDFPNIVGPLVLTSCAEGQYARGTIDELRRRIVETLNNDPRLNHVRDPLPVSWLRVKNAITTTASADKVMPASLFQGLCMKASEPDEIITDDAEIRGLLHLLHDLGTIVAHGLRVGASAAQREITLLDPNWLTQAIYTLLNNEQIRRQEGEFSRENMSAILDAKLYPPDRHEFILEMMEHKDVGLCFEILGSNRQQFLIPELLSANEPEEVLISWPADSLCFRYKYVFLPRSFIPRFIVVAHQMLASPSVRWQTGAVITAAGCHVLLVADRAHKLLDIKVHGPGQMRRSALNVTLAELERVHAINPEMSPTSMVPLPGLPQADEPYEYLLKLESHSGSDHMHLPRGADREYKLSELLDGVGRELRTSSRSAEPPGALGPPAAVTSPTPAATSSPATAAPQSPPALTTPPIKDEALQLLQQQYTGWWGHKVFWLAALTLGPLFVDFKLAHLELSLASIVYLIYHFYGIVIWTNVNQLRDHPHLFSDAQRGALVATLTRRDAVARRLGYLVILLLGFTAIAKLTIIYGDSHIRVPLSEWVYHFLGVPIPPR